MRDIHARLEKLVPSIVHSVKMVVEASSEKKQLVFTLTGKEDKEIHINEEDILKGPRKMIETLFLQFMI